ncbi:MAG: hypothetical protein GXW85_06075 [Clostridia bacterium]|nr:hypothetical protein [Clostridia bacterium]
MCMKWKKGLVFLIIVCISLFTLGCKDSEKVERDVIPKLIEEIVNDTKQAILKKDVQLARETWSKVTEYSVKANEYGDKELSAALSKLATTYVKLIEYCESGDESLLEIFNMEFAKALDKMESFKKIVEELQADRSVFFLPIEWLY